MNLPHALERSVEIRAQRSTVFAFFTESERFAAWWGPGSTIDPRPGGEVVIRYPNGVVARGEVVELQPPERIVFTFGYDSGRPLPVGSSRVTVTLAEAAAGTHVDLRHEFDSAAARDQHVPGWRYQLAVFANVAAAAQHAGVDATIDAFFAVWAEADAAQRRRSLEALCAADVVFRDAHASLRGLDDLAAHVTASREFMPGVVLRRQGRVRQCQGTALVDWQCLRDEAVLAIGTNVFELGPDSRVEAVTGVPARPAR